MKREVIQKVLSYACNAMLEDIKSGAWGQEYIKNAMLVDTAEVVAYAIEENGIDWYLDEHGEDALDDN